MVIEAIKSTFSLAGTIITSIFELYITISGVVNDIKDQMWATVFGVSVGVVVFAGVIIGIVKFIKRIS